MHRLKWKSWLSLSRDVRGDEIAESAIVLPILFMILMAIFWFGQAFRMYGTITHAARQGARAAVVPVCATCSPSTTTIAANAQAAVYNALAASHLSKNQLVPVASWTPPKLCTCLPNNPNSKCQSTPIACDPIITDVCVQENVQLSYPSQGGAGTCGISVSAQYKYAVSFPIPFTNLDLMNLPLPGQAQMRVETQ